MPKTIQEAKQEIDSMIQNLQWETDPNWNSEIFEIRKKIFQYWEVFLDATYNQATHKFER